MIASLTGVEPAGGPAADGLRARILFVDADEAMRSLCGELLVRSGYEVDTVADGAKAWTALQSVPYHLLIAENETPHLTGVELIRKARMAQMTLPVILTSGALGAMSQEEHSLLNCGAILTKPFRVAKLLELIRQILPSATGAETPRALVPGRWENPSQDSGHLIHAG